MLATLMARLPPANSPFPDFPKKNIEIADFAYTIRPVKIIGRAMLYSCLISSRTYSNQLTKKIMNIIQMHTKKYIHANMV